MWKVHIFLAVLWLYAWGIHIPWLPNALAFKHYVVKYFVVGLEFLLRYEGCPRKLLQKCTTGLSTWLLISFLQICEFQKTRVTLGVLLGKINKAGVVLEGFILPLWFCGNLPFRTIEMRFLFCQFRLSKYCLHHTYKYIIQDCWWLALADFVHFLTCLMFWVQSIGLFQEWQVHLSF